MKGKVLGSVVLVSLLSGCGQDQPPAAPEKTFGGQLGDSYKGMLDEARQGVENTNERMLQTERAVDERDP